VSLVLFVGLCVCVCVCCVVFIRFGMLYCVLWCVCLWDDFRCV
jgi:hypothetical protein